MARHGPHVFVVDDEVQIGEVTGRPLEVVGTQVLDVHQPERDALVELEHRDAELLAALVQRVGDLPVVAPP